MPLTGTESVLQADLVAKITAALAKRGNVQIDPKSVEGIAEGIAMAVIPHIVAMAEVAIGIQTAGSPSNQTSITPGKLT